MSTRQRNGFRLDQTAVRRWTRWLLVTMGVLVATGIGLGAWSDDDSAPAWLGTAATVVVIVGFVGPLLVAAVVGGESIRRGGGLVGVLLTYGLVVGATGDALDIPWALWSGGIALGVAVVAFWVMGWLARVPMFIGLPWAHGRTIQNTEPEGPEFSRDDARLRPRRRRDAKARSGPRR